MIGMKPKDAIKLDTIPLDKTYPEETVLPEDGLYRYLYQPGEQHGDEKWRKTDLIWSKKTYRLGRIVQEPDNLVLYYMQDGPDRAFVHEELMRIPEDNQVPPDWVSEWKQSRNIFVKCYKILWPFWDYKNYILGWGWYIIKMSLELFHKIPAFKCKVIKKANYYKNHFSLTKEKQTLFENALNVII